MAACEIVNEFKKFKRKYLTYKHQFSRKSNLEREQKILKFLQFCHKRGVKRIRDISKFDFENFMRQIQDRSLETQRKYRLALSEFVERAKLNFSVKRDVNKQKLKRYNKLKAILKNCAQDECIENLKENILKLL